jgi:hypothetical protein
MRYHDTPIVRRVSAPAVAGFFGAAHPRQLVRREAAGERGEEKSKSEDVSYNADRTCGA